MQRGHRVSLGCWSASAHHLHSHALTGGAQQTALTAQGGALACDVSKAFIPNELNLYLAKVTSLGESITPHQAGMVDGGWWMVDGGWWMVDGGWWMGRPTFPAHRTQVG